MQVFELFMIEFVCLNFARVYGHAQINLTERSDDRLGTEESSE